MSPSPAHRRGYTLLEIIVATVIFTAVIAAIFDSLTAVKRYDTTANAQDEISAEVTSIMTTIGHDLSLSGWYFFGSEDENLNGTLDTTTPPSEDVDGNGAISQVAYSVTSGPLLEGDRKLAYWPAVQVNTDSGRSLRLFQRVVFDAAVVSSNALARLAPFGSAAGSLNDARSVAQRERLLLSDDQLSECISPSGELHFLRVATGSWSADPNDSDFGTTEDMQFFPAYALNPDGSPKPYSDQTRGACAYDWNQPDAAPISEQENRDTHANLPGLVLYASEWRLDGGTYVHRNDPAHNDPVALGDRANQPYGRIAPGAILSALDGSLRVRLQWETITADRMYRDRDTGSDNVVLPIDLRQFCYAVVPSPRGTGRLVRAHSVLLPSGGTDPAAGVQLGERISTIRERRATGTGTERQCLVIDRVLSDHVVRVQFFTRRHDPALSLNQVRVRLVLLRPSATIVDGTRAAQFRVVERVFAMRARHEESELDALQNLVSQPALPGTTPSNTAFIPYPN